MKKKYPYKGEYKDNISCHIIVEFTAPETGKIIEVIKPQNLNWFVGYHSDNWGEERFTPIEEEELKLNIPFMISCRDKYERDAAASFLLSHGCLVHGKENNLDGIYKKLFGNCQTLNVKSPTYFTGKFVEHKSAIPFYENAKEITDILNRKDEIKKGDWVVCEVDCREQYTKGKLYKVKDLICYGDRLLTEIDDRGSNTNGWEIANFRKATSDECPNLPKINGYEGTIDLNAGVVKYGCAELDFKLIENMYNLWYTEYKGNRKVNGVSLKLNSGVKITYEEVEQLWKEIQKVK